MSNTGGGAGGSLPPIYQPIIVTTSGAGQVGNTLRQVASQYGTQMNSMSRSTTGMYVTWRTFGDSLRQTGSLLKYTMAMPLMNLTKQAVQFSTQFEDSLAKIRGLVGVSADQTAKFGDEILKLGPAVGKAPVELADALYFITSAGITGAEAMEVLEASSKAAAAGLGETQVVADAVTSVLNAYGQGAYSSMQATDILTAAVREGKAEASAFAPALGKVLPVASAFGLSFEDIAASVAALTRSGAEAGTSAIYLRQVLNTLLDPTLKAQQAMEGIGLSAATIRERIVGGDLLGALESLNQGFNGNVESMAQVFGNVRALTAVFSLLGPNLEANRKIFDEINGTSGDTQKAFDEIAETTGFKMKAASAEMQASLIQIGDAMAPVIKVLADFGKIAAKAFGFLAGNTGVARAIMVAAGLTAAFAGLIRTFASFVRLKALFQITTQAQATGLRNVYTNVVTNITAQRLYNAGLTQGTTATAANTAAQTTRTAAIGMVTTATGVQIPAIGAATAATTAQTVATNVATTAQRTLAVQFAATAATMMTVIPLIGVAIAAFSLLKPLVGSFFKRGKKEKDSPIDFIEGLKEKGLDFGGYTKIGMDVDLSVASDAAVNEKLNNFKTAYAGYAQKYLDQSDAVRLSIATNLSVGIDGGQDEDINALIANMFNIDEAMFQKEMKGIDLGTIVQAGIDTALANVDLSTDDLTDQITKEAAESYRQGLRGSTYQLTGPVKDFAENIGKQISPALQAGNVGVFQGFLDQILEQSKYFGDEIGLRSQFINAAINKAFGEAGFKEGDDLIEILIKNSAELPPALQNVGNAFLDLKNNGNEFTDDGYESIRLFDALVDKVDESTDSFEDNLSLAEKITAAYQDGVNPEVNETKAVFEAASDAVKKMKAAQEALYSPTFDLIDSQTGLRDSLRGVADATNEASGGLFAGTEKSDAALSNATKAAQDILDIANNTFAATGDVDAAARAAGEGISGLTQALLAGGASEAEVQKFFNQFGNAFSYENIRNTLEGSDPQKLGESQGDGIAEGIISSIPSASNALKTLLSKVLNDGRLYIESRSPSQLFAREVGMPIGQGIAEGIVSSGNEPATAIKDVSQGTLTAAKKFLQIQSPSKKFEDYVGKPIPKGIAKGVIKGKGELTEKTKEILKDALDAAIDNAKTFQNVFSTRLGFKKAQLDLTKFQREQALAPTKLARAQRKLGRTERQFGANGGTEVTSYEASKIEEAQKDVEKLRREYALGRAPLSDLIDAEENLAEMRDAAVEKAPEIVDAQNDVDDAQFNVTNSADLLAEKQAEVAIKYGEMVAAATEFNVNSAAVIGSFKTLAQEAGFSNTEISTMTTGIQGARTTLGTLTDPLKSTEFKDSLTSAVKLVTDFVSAVDKAGKNSKFDGINFGNTPTTTPATVTEPIAGARIVNINGQKIGVTASGLVATINPTSGNPLTVTSPSVELTAQDRLTITQNLTKLSPDAAAAYAKALFGRAKGGPVSSGQTYIVGEEGPELFIPRSTGTIVPNTELQRYTKTSAASGSSSVTSNSFNVNVYNPVPETASDSIGRKLRDLSYSGLFG